MSVGDNVYALRVNFRWHNIESISLMEGRLVSYDEKSAMIERKFLWFKWLESFPRKLVFVKTDDICKRLLGEA